MAGLAYLKINSASNGCLTLGCNTLRSMGNSYQSTHEDEITVLSFENSICYQNKATHQPIQIIKNIDKSTPLLLQACVDGDELSCRLEFYRPSATAGLEAFYEIRLIGAKIKSVTMHMPTARGVEDNVIQEAVVISYRDIITTHLVAKVESSSSDTLYVDARDELSEFDKIPPLSASVVEYEKKHGLTKKTINVTSPTIEEMLDNPELDGISSVNIDPVSMAVETAVDLIEGAKEFVSNPSLGGVAAMAVTAIPGKYADKVLDELPIKKLNDAVPKSLKKMKRFKVPCFEPKKGIKIKYKGRERELESHFARQLKHQETGLNDLTVGEYVENRNRYKTMKRKGTGLAQEEFRKDFSNDLKESLKDNYNKKMPPKEAKAKAEQRTINIMDNLAALHDPDMIAGGGDKVSRMGNKNVNSSLGSQWRGEDRLTQMDEQAQKALETFGADAKMNVSLERCPLRGNK